MNRVTEMELMRLLRGELPPDRERALRARIEREPALAAVWARLERSWSGLELPPPAPVSPGFAQRVTARAREQAEAVSWAAAPRRVRATAAVALLAGIGLGAAAALPDAGEQVSTAATESAETLFDDNLAESYWSTLDELGDAEPPAVPGEEAL